jgi:hypothetical protein
MSLLKTAMDLYVALEKEKEHGAAAVLAFKLAAMVPALIEHAERMELSVRQNIRHIVCKCSWCGEEFKVFHSEMRAGKKSGKYCSMACWEETRADAKSTRIAEASK